MVNPKLKPQDSGLPVQFLLSCVLCLTSIIASSAPFDSLRLETINGKQFIIHQVDPKETLYSISRRYVVAVALIRDENPSVDAGLSVGQIVRVPYIPRAKPKTDGVLVHKVTTKETLFSISRLYDVTVDDIKTWNNIKDNSINIGQDLVIRKKTATPEVAKSLEPKSLKGVHKVVEKETLFSISKMYGASIQQLKSWNYLTSDEVKPGQILYVIQPMYNSQSEEKQTVQLTKPANQEMKISETVIGSDEIHEKGTAELIEGTDGNRKYLAQHKTAKVGTIMKVRNEATNREVFVRVVAPLISDGNTVIKVSHSAFERLGAVDPKFNVELIYYK